MTLDFRQPGNVTPRTPSRRPRFSQKLADKHASWRLGLPDFIELTTENIPAIIAIGGGKGGVGKSIVSANLAVKLAASGFRVLVIDLDLGCANLHTHFGISKPKYSLTDFVFSTRRSFSEIIIPTNVPNLGLIAGGQEASWGQKLANLNNQFAYFWSEVFRSKQDMQVDIVLFDLGAGTLAHTINFFTAAHLGIITVLPEPTSLENAYVFIKAYIWHIIENVAKNTNQRELGADVRASLVRASNQTNASGFLECLGRLSTSYPEYISDILKSIGARPLGIVVNQTRSQTDIDIGPSMEVICQKYFGIKSHSLGHLSYDDAAWKSLKNRRLLLSDFPHSILARCMNKVTQNVISILGY